ncbi:MAG: hypothetical protein ACE14V_01255 [bacterium]
MIGLEHLVPLLAGFLTRAKGQKFSFQTLLDIVKETVEAVEKVFTTTAGKSSDEKKRLALEAIEYLYKQLGINIPKLPTWLELWILRTVAGIIIDWLVGIYNEKKVFEHEPSQPEI